MIMKFPTALTVAAVFSAIGAGLYLICCVINVVRIVGRPRMEQEHAPPVESSLQRLAAVRFVYDYDFCETVGELQETIRRINEQRFILVSVVHDGEAYTVFFRRMLNG